MLTFVSRLSQLDDITGPDIPILLHIINLTIGSLFIFLIDNIVKSISNPIEITLVLLRLVREWSIQGLEIGDNPHKGRQRKHGH